MTVLDIFVLALVLVPAFVLIYLRVRYKRPIAKCNGCEGCPSASYCSGSSQQPAGKAKRAG